MVYNPFIEVKLLVTIDFKSIFWRTWKKRAWWHS